MTAFAPRKSFGATWRPWHAKKIHVVAAGGTANHVHLLVLLLNDCVGNGYAGTQGEQLAMAARDEPSLFQWQRGYGAFSVSESRREMVAHYIANQASITANEVSKRNIWSC